MTAPSPVVKSVAKDALKKNFLRSVVVCCVLIFVFFVVMLTSSLISVFAGSIGYTAAFSALLFLIVEPLLLGVFNYFRRLIFEQDDSVLIIFKYFSSAKEYKRAIHFITLLTIRFIGVALVLYLPCIIVTILSNEAIYSFFNLQVPLWTSNLWALNSFLAILAFFGIVFIMLKYYLAPIIFVGNDTLEPAEAVHMSTIIAKRSGADFFGLVLSFIPWMLLSVFVAPLMFTLPYFITSYCVHSRFAITVYNCDVDKMNSSVTPSFSTDEI